MNMIRSGGGASLSEICFAVFFYDLLFCRMYSKQEASLMRQSFWTAFGRYMAPVPAADGAAVNWINYHTGIKDVFFRMNADKNGATIGIELIHPETAKRDEVFDLLLLNQSILHEVVAEQWIWQRETLNPHRKPIASISKTEPGVNIFKREHWPGIISFFKPRIIALDQFWQQVKPFLE